MPIEQGGFSDSPEEQGNPSEGKEGSAIENAQSFDELYEAIKAGGDVEGSRKTYTSDEVIGIIEQVRSGRQGLDYVTSRNGIHDAVDRLLESDKTYQDALKKQSDKGSGGFLGRFRKK